MTSRRARRVALTTLLVLSLIAGVAVLLHGASASRRTHLTAYFDSSNGVFPGDEIRILGMPVGKIDSIEAQPQRVKISFWVDEKYKVPAEVQAAILAPSLVTARAIQLTPPYTGGPQLPSGSVIPLERTVVPIEWDDFREQLQKLTDTLQPSEPGGVSSLGALINSTADNLRGQGPNIRDALVKMSRAFSALGDHSKDVFGTVKSLATLVTALQASTDLMEQLNNNLAAVSSVFANTPDEVGSAVADLNAAVTDVQQFVADNTDAAGAATDQLASISTALNESLDDVKQALHIAPTTFQNFVNIYQPAQNALTGVLALNNFSNPVSWLCGAVQAASRLNAEQSSKLCVQYLAPIMKNRQFNFPPFGLNPVVGAQARPNELTYSEEWLRPDYRPAEPAPDAPAPDAAPLPAEAPPPPEPVTTDPTQGLTGLMVPPGGGS